MVVWIFNCGQLIGNLVYDQIIPDFPITGFNNWYGVCFHSCVINVLIACSTIAMSSFINGDIEDWAQLSKRINSGEKLIFDKWFSVYDAQLFSRMPGVWGRSTNNGWSCLYNHIFYPTKWSWGWSKIMKCLWG